ncbi:MAG: IclR family transcriptional regulator [Acidobacteria bacterium]|nr:IclR family transcriptional regulator [Acidobacteriota bacterium]
MNPPAEKARDYQVASVRKALELLCAFSTAGSTLTVSDLSRYLSIPKSTTHNLLRTLQSLSFVTQDEEKRFCLGPRVFELGLLFSRNTQLVTRAMPHLRRLADETKETVKLGIISNDELLVVVAIESPYQLHTRGDQGLRAPLHCTSLGKALLALLAGEQVREIAARHGMPRFTAHTITSLNRLEEELLRIRRLGFALDREEHEEGVLCAAAGFIEPSSGAVGAISISGPGSRITESRLLEFGALVWEAARDIAGISGSPAEPAHDRKTIVEVG